MRTDVEVPSSMRSLRRDSRGYIVPWFVHWDGDTPDFRIIGDGKFAAAVEQSRCWVCGGERGRFAAFVVGPMCAVNRVSGEPPCHRECAIYSAMVCPFLTRPKMRRNDKDLPPETFNDDGSTKVTGGFGIARNPGVALVWVTRKWRCESVFNGYLISIGDPTATLWFCEGRPATRAEALASIDSGLPILQDLADKQGPAARAALVEFHQRALAYLPAAEAP